MANTWEHLKFATEAFHYMTEVIADLEITLKDQGIDTNPLPVPDEPPIPDGGNPCMPPRHCEQITADLNDYTGRLGSYIDSLFERTTALLTLARNAKVERFPYRVVDRPDPIRVEGTKKPNEK